MEIISAKRCGFIILFCVFLLAACTADKAAAGSVNCYYKWDCPNGQICADGKCIEDPGLVDNMGISDTSVTGDKDVSDATEIIDEIGDKTNDEYNEAAVAEAESDISDDPLVPDEINPDTDESETGETEIPDNDDVIIIDEAADNDDTIITDDIIVDETQIIDEDSAVADDAPDADTAQVPLSVKTVTPVDKSVNVIADIITVEFSRPVKRGKLGLKFQREGLTSIQTLVPVETQAILSSWTFVIAPDYSDAYKYTVTVPAAVQDENNITLGSDYIWYFNVDKNECATGSNNCDKITGTCVNTAGSFECGCKNGYLLDADGHTCSDIDECQAGTSTCHEFATCTNTTGLYTCQCKANYSGNGYNCTADTRTFNCADKPANTDWNTVSSYSQTWSGSEWLPADSATDYNATPGKDVCRYKCTADYHWDGAACVSNTRTYNCPSKPGGTIWNTVSSYPQTWSGSEWLPADTATEYNTTPSSTACLYVCDTYHTWNGNVCEAETQTFTCQDKPATGTVWNTVSSYTQSWDGSSWLPADDNTTEYNATGSATSCQYKCDTGDNYNWDVSISKCTKCGDGTKEGVETCEIGNTVTCSSLGVGTIGTASCNSTCSGWITTSCQRDYDCADKPATGTLWNTVSKYTQTWSGSQWLPADDSTTEYNASAGTTTCQYKCDTDNGYNWDVSISKCTKCGDGTKEGAETCEIGNTTTCSSLGVGTSGSASCNSTCSGWVTTTCQRTYTCPGKPATGTEWNTVSSYPQTWNGSAWLPADTATTYNTSPSSTACQYTCAANYTWNSSACVQSCPTIINSFYYDFNSAAPGWSLGTGWGLGTYSGMASLGNGAGTNNYADGLNSAAESPAFDLSSCGSTNVRLRWSQHGELEYNSYCGGYCDLGYVEFWNGSAWVGSNNVMPDNFPFGVENTYTLPAGVKINGFKMRFRITSDSDTNYAGIKIDWVKLETF